MNATETKNYQVKVKFQFPAWNERDGISLVVTAESKRAAIKKAKRHLHDTAGTGPGCLKGLQWWSATETDEIADDLSLDY